MASTSDVQMRHNSSVLERPQQCGPRRIKYPSSMPTTMHNPLAHSKPWLKDFSLSNQPNSNRVAHSEQATKARVPSTCSTTVRTVSQSTFTLNQSSVCKKQDLITLESRFGNNSVTLQNTAIIKTAADAFLALHKKNQAMFKVQNQPRSTSSRVPSTESREKLDEIGWKVSQNRPEAKSLRTTARSILSTDVLVSNGGNYGPSRNRSNENEMVIKRNRRVATSAVISETETRLNSSRRMCVNESKMAAYLVCLTAGGVPLFTRKTADFKSLPFPLVGSLNGVRMFAKSHDATLLTTSTEDTDVAWREFNESITLIVVLTDRTRRKTERSEVYLYDFLETVFDAMVFLAGLDNIVDTNNVERLKRDLKGCFCLVDALLSQLTQPSESLSFVGDLAHSVDCIVCPESASLQSYLDSFVESAYCNYGCVLVRGKIVVATKEWWTLDGRESFLLSFFLASTTKTTCRDVPVFLPVESPTVAHRLLVFQLVQGVEVCVLCGPTPSLIQLQREVGRAWKNAYELLKTSLHYHPRNFPENLLLDKHILGFILINIRDRKSLCSVHPQRNECEGLLKNDSSHSKITSEHRLQILRSYYKLTVGTVFRETSEEGSESTNDCNPFAKDTFLNHCCQETYLIAITHKLYALRTDQYQIFVMYSSTMPAFALRGITNNTLQLLTKGKHLRV